MPYPKLTPDRLPGLAGRSVCCIEKSTAYLEELCAKYDILDSISCIVDANARNHGSFVFHGRELTVYGMEHLRLLERDKTVLLITSDYDREVYDALAGTLPDIGAWTVYYFPSRETEYELAYRGAYRDRPLENTIIFRSGPHASSYVKGMDFADNARALFEYMLSVGLNEKYRLVWLVKNPAEFGRYRTYQNVEFLSFDWSASEAKEERDAYYQALCTAKYLFFTDAYGFARNCRKDQTRVQLWHGCGFKTRVNFVRCEHRYEYNTVISDVYARIHARIYGLRPEQVLVTGYPKADWLFEQDRTLFGRLHVPAASRYIFWLPTFRTAKSSLEQLNEYELGGETGLPIVKKEQELGQLNTVLCEHDTLMVIKLHPFQRRDDIRCGQYSNIFLLENEALVQEDIQINRLLGCADALLSDYSSAAVDYLLLDRPMGFLLEDAGEYEESRGFVFKHIRDWLPGMEIYDFKDVCRFVREVMDGVDSTREKRQRLRARMHRYHDNQSSRRVTEALHIE